MTPHSAEAATRANGLSDFFARQRRRADRRVALPLALLSTHGLRYLFTRGGVLFARVPLRTALHAAEIIVLSEVLEFGVLGPLLAIRSVVTAFGAFHWGALEPLRRGVQAALARGEPDDAGWETARYLRLAVDLCIVQLLAIVLWLEFGPRPYDAFSIFDAYTIGCGLRMMAETITRTYHAGAFSLRRVRRPFASLLAIDVVDVGVVIALWPFLGFWGFGVAQIAGGVVEAVLAIVYARRTYRDLPFPAPTLRRVLSSRASGSWSLLRGMLLPGFANLSAQVDALLITALAFGPSGHGLGVASALHVFRPVLSLGSGWARLFYFDLTHLRPSVQKLFRARFERLLLFAAPCFAFASLALGALLAGHLLSGRAVAALPLLAPFFIARALFATAQIQAFARGAHGVLALGGALVLTVALILRQLGQDTAILMDSTVLTLTLATVLFFWGARRHDTPDPLPTIREPLPPLTFFGSVARLTSPVTLHLLTLNPTAGAHALRVARALATLPEVTAITRFTPSTLIIASTNPPSPSRWIAPSGGTLLDVTALRAHPTGPLALASLLRDAELPLQGPAPTAHELRAHFARDFPHGIVLDAKRGALPRAAATPRQLAATLHELGEQATGLRPQRRRGLRAATYAPGGSAQIVFIPPRDADATRFAAFERQTFEASLHATLETPPPHTTPAPHT